MAIDQNEVNVEVVFFAWCFCLEQNRCRRVTLAGNRSITGITCAYAVVNIYTKFAEQGIDVCAGGCAANAPSLMLEGGAVGLLCNHRQLVCVETNASSKTYVNTLSSGHAG